MARLGNDDSVTPLLKTKPARLLKMTVADLQRLRKKLTGVTDPSLLAPPAGLQVEAVPDEEIADGADLLDLVPEPVEDDPEKPSQDSIA